jgi:hypothetical protein
MMVVAYGVPPFDYTPFPHPVIPYPSIPASAPVDPVPGLVKMLQEAMEARCRVERKAEDLEKRVKDLEDRIRSLGFEP